MDPTAVPVTTYGEGFSSGFGRFQHSQEFCDVSGAAAAAGRQHAQQYCQSRLCCVAGGWVEPVPAEQRAALPALSLECCSLVQLAEDAIAHPCQGVSLVCPRKIALWVQTRASPNKYPTCRAVLYR